MCVRGVADHGKEKRERKIGGGGGGETEHIVYEQYIECTMQCIKPFK